MAELDFLNSIFDDNYEKATSKVRLGSTTELTGSSNFTPAQAKNLDPLAEAVNKTSLAPSATEATLEAETPKMAALTKARLGVVGAQFLTDIMNAQSAYQTTTTAVQQNLMLSKLNEEDTYYRGRQKAMDQRSQGNLNADEALSNLAAQGIDISGAGAQNIVEGYRSMGAYAAMREEMNMYREAFKYDMEQVQLEMQGEIAGYNRNTQMLGSLLNAGVQTGFAVGGAGIKKESLWD